MQRIALRAANRLKDLLYVPGTARAHLEDARGKVACLLYHRVVDPAEDRFNFLTRGGVPAITPRELASDIAFLAQKDAKFFTFEDLQDGSFPSRGEFGVIVCFDDCFRDNYEAGRAVLEKHGVRGVFFQTSSLVDRRDLLWEHALYWCGRDSVARERLRQLGHRVLGWQHASFDEARATLLPSFASMFPSSTPRPCCSARPTMPASSGNHSSCQASCTPVGNMSAPRVWLVTRSAAMGMST